MPGTIDLVVAGLIAIAYPFWDYLSWQRMMKVMASGRPDARLAIYHEIIATLWTMTAVIAALWVRAARPWQPIGLVLPLGWRLGVSVALAAAVWMLFRAQLRKIRSLDGAKLDRIRARTTDVAPLIPRNPTEFAWFVPVGISAGICEEFIFRGFLIWAFQPWLGLWGAALASTVSFGLVHSYQGPAGATRAGVVGAVFALLTIALGSIIPAMVLHAMLDLLSAQSSYAVYAERPGNPVAA